MTFGWCEDYLEFSNRMGRNWSRLRIDRFQFHLSKSQNHRLAHNPHQAPMITHRLIWKRDNSEGLRWYVRGIHSDGRLSGDLRFQSDDPSKCRACSIESALTERDRVALAENVQRLPFRDQLPSGAYAVIVEVDPDGQDGSVFAYNPGDEFVTTDAATFVGIIEILRPYVESAWKCYW